MLSPSSTVSTVSTPSPQMFLLLLVDTSSDHNLHHTEQPPPTVFSPSAVTITILPLQSHTTSPAHIDASSSHGCKPFPKPNKLKSLIRTSVWGYLYEVVHLLHPTTTDNCFLCLFTSSKIHNHHCLPHHILKPLRIPPILTWYCNLKRCRKGPI
ncbi:hypothetical protein L2E82_20759 [Cichorium intybus]|uniref:Uncharacterized protein n=1 Tax=Cichorium intybus TaxID=13427 RepID=A0ACB9DTX2_CICIN|nr:hypothetical protein L2E82_20759 [Cichorium intybus]